MRVALVHDYLNQVGGGERVLTQLMRMFPDAPVYTLLYDEKKTRGAYAGRVRKTSFLDFQFARDHHRLFIPLMPLAARSLDLGSEYDLIISDSAGFGKGVRYNHATTKHLCYVHTPLRYAWETDTYFGHNLKAQIFNTIFLPAFAYVRRFDYWAGQQPDMLLANSAYIAEKVRRYYNREASVLYPAISDTWSAGSQINAAAVPPYYLAAGRLLHYKRFDLVIDACKKSGRRLKIVGDGPERRSLEARARGASSIEFLGYVSSDEELRNLYAGATAFIMPNEEDFGLVMAEAQASGTPVLAYGVGGACEIVDPRVTGLLFHEQTPETLIAAMDSFDRLSFDRKVISASARRFNQQAFEDGVRAAIKKMF